MWSLIPAAFIRDSVPWQVVVSASAMLYMCTGNVISRLYRLSGMISNSISFEWIWRQFGHCCIMQFKGMMYSMII